MKQHAHLLVRDALAELFVEATAGDPEADLGLEALIRWSRGEGVRPALLSLQVAEGSPLFGPEGLQPRFESLEGYTRDRAQRFAAARAWVREESAEPDPIERARAAWDAGLFFEVHEILEPVWLKDRGPERGALQGLIMAAASLHHLSNGNRAGARGLAREAARRLASAPETFPIEVEPLAQALEKLTEQLEKGGVRDAADLEEVPPFRSRAQRGRPDAGTPPRPRGSGTSRG